MSERVSAAEGASSPKKSERESGASERANGRASGPVLTSGFLDILALSAMDTVVMAIVAKRPTGCLIEASFLSLDGSISHFGHDVIRSADEQIVPNRRPFLKWLWLKGLLRGCGIQEGGRESGG